MKESKQTIRNEIKKKRRNLDAKFAKEASLTICRYLRELVSNSNRHGICAFYPSFGEPDILPLLMDFLKKSWEIYLPKWSENEGYRMSRVANFADALLPGRFSIPEPVSGDFLDKSDMERLLWFVPGIAFSKSGVRLGYGEGTYDRLLYGVEEGKIGICYDFQILTDLPSESHDVKMNYLVTEKNIYKLK